MSEELKKTEVLTSDAKVLSKIKYLQFKKQMLPLGLVILLIIGNTFLQKTWMLYPVLVCFAWFLLTKIMYRTKNRIAAPEAGTFVSPVNGNVKSIKRDSDFILLSIRKSWLDVLELRLPYSDLQMEDIRNWNFETPAGQVNIRIQAKKILFFDNKNVLGAVFGAVPGSAVFIIKVPSTVFVNLKEGDPVFGGESELFRFDQIADATGEHKSILAE